MNSNDTIFALATAFGKGGVAVIRISGAAACDALKTLGATIPKPRRASLRTLYHPQHSTPGTQHIDKALVISFPAPNSFTGEDVVELHTHGSMAVVKELLEVLGEIDGFRMAEPGEFSRRAFENGRMDLAQAEGIADLIDAETKAQQQQALRQMGGEISAIYEDFRARLVNIMANIEAYIDFPDEDIPENIEAEMLDEIRSLMEQLNEYLGDRRGEMLRDGINIAIIGAPNVGKSSLLNWLARRDVAIVSDIAGTTRDMLEVRLDIKGYPVIVTDTAGLRASDDKIEVEGVRRAFRKAEDADLKICMFDATAWPEQDSATAGLVDEDSIVVVNKVDKVDIVQDEGALPISIHNGAGMEELLDRMEREVAGCMEGASSAVITNQRHRAAVLAAVKHLEQFLEGRQQKRNIELCAEDLRMAGREIGKITGTIGVEDILDKVFSSFCIGK